MPPQLRFDAPFSARTQLPFANILTPMRMVQSARGHAKFLPVREEILLKILDAVENGSASSAYATQPIVLKDSQ